MGMFFNIALIIFCLVVCGIWWCYLYEYAGDVILSLKEPSCPHCGDWLIEEDVYNIETLDDHSAIITTHTGSCPTCKRDFQWQTKYTKNKIFFIFKE